MTRSTCREILRCIDTYVDGELEPSEMLSMQQHVEGCEECSSRVSFEKSTRASVRNVVQATRASDLLRARIAHALAEQREVVPLQDRPTENRATLDTGPQMLS
jgi:anti-sigma factor (TIGR02949 family)